MTQHGLLNQLVQPQWFPLQACAAFIGQCERQQLIHEMTGTGLARSDVLQLLLPDGRRLLREAIVGERSKSPANGVRSSCATLPANSRCADALWARRSSSALSVSPNCSSSRRASGDWHRREVVGIPFLERLPQLAERMQLASDATPQPGRQSSQKHELRRQRIDEQSLDKYRACACGLRDYHAIGVRRLVIQHHGAQGLALIHDMRKAMARARLWRWRLQPFHDRQEATRRAAAPQRTPTPIGRKARLSLRAATAAATPCPAPQPARWPTTEYASSSIASIEGLLGRNSSPHKAQPRCPPTRSGLLCRNWHALQDARGQRWRRRVVRRRPGHASASSR